MKHIYTLEERIEELKEEFEKKLEELKEEYQEELKEEYQEEFPKKGQDYYYIDETGLISCISWTSDCDDFGSLAMGNVFRTEEEAEFAVEKLKVITELKKFSRPFKYEEDNYRIRYDSFYEKIDFDTLRVLRTAELYFESEEKARAAIEAVGEERIKKYYLEVE